MNAWSNFRATCLAAAVLSSSLASAQSGPPMPDAPILPPPDNVISPPPAQAPPAPQYPQEPPPPSAPSELVFKPEALPWAQLLGKSTRKQIYGVVFMPSQGRLTPALLAQLHKGLIDSLKKQPAVRTADVYPNAGTLGTLPDEEVARRAGDELDVDRVLVVRTQPTQEPGGAPRVVLSLLTADGEMVQTVTSVNVISLAHPAETAPPAPIVIGPVAPTTPLPDGNDENQRQAALAMFKERALLLGEDDADGIPAVMRNGRTLSDEELDTLGAPEPLTAKGGGGLRPAVAWGYGLLTPLIGVLPILGCLGGIGLCAVGGSLFGLVANGADIFGGVVSYGLYCGICCGGPLGMAAGLLGLLVGGVGTSVGGYGLYNEFNRGGGPDAPVHPYVGFVRNHNKELARSLGLRPSELGRKYFPTS